MSEPQRPCTVLVDMTAGPGLRRSATGVWTQVQHREARVEADGFCVPRWAVIRRHRDHTLAHRAANCPRGEHRTLRPSLVRTHRHTKHTQTPRPMLWESPRCGWNALSAGRSAPGHQGGLCFQCCSQHPGKHRARSGCWVLRRGGPWAAEPVVLGECEGSRDGDRGDTAAAPGEDPSAPRWWPGASGTRARPSSAGPRCPSHQPARHRDSDPVWAAEGRAWWTRSNWQGGWLSPQQYPAGAATRQDLGTAWS